MKNRKIFTKNLNWVLILIFFVLRVGGFLAFIHLGKIKETIFDLFLRQHNAVENQLKLLDKNSIDN